MYTPNPIEFTIQLFFLGITWLVIMKIVNSPQLQHIRQNMQNMLNRKQNTRNCSNRNQVSDENKPHRFEPATPPNYLRISMERDGNCFFRAIAQSEYNDKELHMYAREKIVNAFFKNDLNKLEFSPVDLEVEENEIAMKNEYYWKELQMLSFEDPKLVDEYLKEIEERVWRAERVRKTVNIDDNCVQIYMKISEVDKMLSKSWKISDEEKSAELANFRWGFQKEKLLEDGEWASDYCISAATKFLRKNIHIYDHETRNWITKSADVEGADTIYLEYVNRKHYNLLEKS